MLSQTSTPASASAPTMDPADARALYRLEFESLMRRGKPKTLEEADRLFKIASDWGVAVRPHLPENDPERFEVANAIAAATEFCQEFKMAKFTGYNLDDLMALDKAVVTVLVDAPRNVLFLHNDYLPPHLAAARMFGHFAQTGEMYRRGDAVVEINKRSGMKVLTPNDFRSRLNKRGRKVWAIKKTQTDPPELFGSPKHCGEDVAKVLLATTEVELLPEIKLVAAMPLLVEHEGNLVTTRPGYNPECGVLVTGAAAVRDIPIQEAGGALVGLLRDFQFTAPGDRSRALAGLIAPAIRMGALLPIEANALINGVEANDSQAGKGTLLELTHAIYGETPYTVVQREGGVGSFDESFAAALMSGKPFVTLDNLRGAVNSTLLEGTVTPVSGDGRVAVRLPHRGEVRVDVSRTLIDLTSNGFSSTRDIANRLLITRLIKKAADYVYATWEGGSLLQHVKQFAPYYLSCVHAIIRYWHAHGKPQLATTHTFKPWVGALDWIVQSVWRAEPLLAGHADATDRLANKNLSWLRQLAHAVIREGKGGPLSGLKAGDLREVCERNGLMPEGVRPGHEDNQAERAIGFVMAACFRDSESVELDGIRVTRTQQDEKREDHRDYRPIKFYTFVKL